MVSLLLRSNGGKTDARSKKGRKNSRQNQDTRIKIAQKGIVGHLRPKKQKKNLLLMKNGEEKGSTLSSFLQPQG